MQQKKRQANRKTILPFIQQFPNSFVVPYILLTWKDWDGKELHPENKRPYYDQLPEMVKNSYYGKLLKVAIEKSEQANKFNPGDVFPDLSVFSRDNKAEKLLNLVKKNKITLIDCWHSGCHPCREQFPEVEMLRAKYKDRGFDVVGISSDKDILSWTRALDKDKPSWPNFIHDKDLSPTTVLDLYGLGAYILVDKDGKMIAFDGLSKNTMVFGGEIRGEALDRKLEVLLEK